MTVWDLVRILLTATFGVINILTFSDWRFNKKKTVLIAAVFLFSSFVFIVLLTAFAKDFMRSHAIFLLVLQMVSVLLFAFFIGRQKGFKFLFVVMIALLFNQIGAVITLSFAVVVKIKWALYLLYFVVYALINAMNLLFFRKIMLKMLSFKNANWVALFTLALFVYLTLIIIVPLPSHISDQFNSFAGLLISLSVIWVFAFMKREMRFAERSRIFLEGKRVMESEVSKMEAQINLMASNEKKLSILRHDLRQNVRITYELLMAQDYIGCKEMLSSLNNALVDIDKNVSKTRFCKNKFLNSILCFYADQFEIEDIGFQTEISVLDSEDPILREFAVVIGNCLENALNASKNYQKANKPKAPSVVLKLYPAGKQMFLEIVNLYVGEVLFDSVTGYPITKVKGHGIGMQSIYTFASQYSATVSFSANADVFTVRIIL